MPPEKFVTLPWDTPISFSSKSVTGSLKLSSNGTGLDLARGAAVDEMVTVGAVPSKVIKSVSEATLPAPFSSRAISTGI